MNKENREEKVSRLKKYQENKKLILIPIILIILSFIVILVFNLPPHIGLFLFINAIHIWGFLCVLFYTRGKLRIFLFSIPSILVILTFLILYGLQNSDLTASMLMISIMLYFLIFLICQLYKLIDLSISAFKNPKTKEEAKKRRKEFLSLKTLSIILFYVITFLITTSLLLFLGFQGGVVSAALPLIFNAISLKSLPLLYGSKDDEQTKSLSLKGKVFEAKMKAYSISLMGTAILFTLTQTLDVNYLEEIINIIILFYFDFYISHPLVINSIMILCLLFLTRIILLSIKFMYKFNEDDWYTN